MDNSVQRKLEKKETNLSGLEHIQSIDGYDKNDYEKFLLNMPKSLYYNLSNNLFADKDFLYLKTKSSTVTLFEKSSVSNLELWHSGTIKWIIDPRSDIGLGTFPLKRFLSLIINPGIVEIKDQAFMPEIDIASIETNEIDLEKVSFKNELSFKNKDKNGRIDIFGENKRIRIIIENKIKSRESKDQTKNYFEWSESNKGELVCIYVFLTADISKSPQCDSFIKITYQNLCDYVIIPCLKHPELQEKSKYILSEYLEYLGKNYVGKKSIVCIDKDTSVKLYEKHKIILDKIYYDVIGKIPLNNRSYNRELIDLINAGSLNINDILISKYMEKTYKARLIEEDGKIQIIFNGSKYILSEYLENLGKNYVGKKSMVCIDKDTSVKLYEEYKVILDKIYYDVIGKTPLNNRSYNSELIDLINAGLLNIDDILSAKYMGKTYEARLIEEDDKIQIIFNGNKYNSPSGLAKEICEQNTNGWIFWEVNNKKLSQLRDELRED